MKTMTIPADPRCEGNSRALVTNEMKAEHIGEFSWNEQADYYDENGKLVEHIATRTVPWDLVKEIYKRMAHSASLQVGT